MSIGEDERSRLEAVLPDGGPWRVLEVELPPGAPRTVWAGRDVVAWVGSPARVAAERTGWERLAEHPARPAWIAVESPTVVAMAPFGEAVDDPVAVVRAAPGDARRFTGTRRELLEGLVDVNVPRALGRHVGTRRRDLDRWLAARVEVETEVGPVLGGVHPGWLRWQGDRAVCLRCDRARAEGWRAVDLAGLSLDGRDLEPLRAAHGEGDAREAAFDLAWVAVATAELARSDDAELAARVAALVRGEREPSTVRVFVEGPPFVDPAQWERPGAEVSASRARWLLRTLDGLAVGGQRMRVRTEPPIRAGRGAPPRGDRATRRRRLFARWDEGIEVDDEGLLSATPEALAMRIARGARGVVLDGTCGVGALSIAYARQPGVTRVIAVDLDAARLRMAGHNAGVYGVAERIELVHGDVVELAGRLAADLLVLDPPWGGRGYDRERVSLDELGLDVRRVLERFSGPVVLKLPRSFDVATLPPGFAIEALVDERGILKMLIARR
jgi:trimethylguanosine synthase